MRRMLLVLALVAAGGIAVVAAGLVLAGGPDERPEAAETGATGVREASAGRLAPPLEGRHPLGGRPVALADYEGRAVAVHVWASWCRPCEEGAEAVRRLAEEHGEDAVLGIDYQDTVPQARGFYERTGWRHASIFDPSGELAARLGVRRLPTTIFLDPEHRIVDRVEGPAGYETLAERLAEAGRAG